MALTHQKVVGVISQPPDMRKDFEVNNLLPWFRKKSDLFRNLKTERLFDIIKNLQFVKKNPDELIIRQGDQGDCMYILLLGQVTIYILYNKSGENEDDKPVQPAVSNKNESLRQQLGTFVTHLGAGSTFGEVALMSDDCIRTASIIADDKCELIVIDRDLYNRSVENVLKKEFEDKSNFVARSPYFQGWAPRYKKQLTMALQKESMPYEGILTRQGEPLEAIYFILSGEVKVLMDPNLHTQQYPKLFETNNDAFNPAPKKDDEEGDEVRDLIRQMSGSNSRKTTDPTLKFRKKVVKKLKNEVCLLGVNESVGDMELFLDLDTYMQTAVCTQKTEVLVLELKHYERLLVKRNPRTIENMKENLEIRLQSRISKHLETSIPLLKILHGKAEEYNEIRQQQIEARMNANVEKVTKTNKSIADTFESFVPPRGALIDIYGPGTVFYRIRQREEAKALRAKKGRNMFGGVHGNAQRAADMPPGSSPGPRQGHAQKQSVDHQTSDPVLSNLENKMKKWMTNDSARRSEASVRVVKLPRSHTELDHEIKPGAKVVLRPVVSPVASSRDGQEDDSLIHHGHAWV